MTTITAISAAGVKTTSGTRPIESPVIADAAREETIQWIKRLRFVAFDGCSMRERFTYRGDSLWWFTELYLHKMRQLDAAVAAILALEDMVAAHDPARIEVDSTERAVQDAARAFGDARGLPVAVSGVATLRGSRWAGFLTGASAALSRLRPSRTPARPAPGTVAAFIHTAFWRPDGQTDGPEQERYVGAVLRAVADQGGAEALTCIGVGPHKNFRARRWFDPLTPAERGRPLVTPIERYAPAEALRESRTIWLEREALRTAITSGDGIRAAALVRGCDLWPILERELAAVAEVQWPWSARAMDEAAAALDAIAPRVAVTYAEAGGYGRALVLEARRRGIPTVGLQHGFIYRHWLNYRHEPDEMEPAGDDGGFPRPDRTLLFDGYAASYLERAGHFPASALAVTGSPQLDAIAAGLAAARRDRGAIRREYGLAHDQALAVCVAKWTEIRHELPALAAAVAARPGVLLVIKAHPAETPEAYGPAVGGIANIRVLAASEPLTRLFAAADGLITMNSTLAIDGLVVGVPALVLGLPNNLSPFVDAGVMLGVAAQASPAAALDALLYDRTSRARLLDAGAAFAAAHGMRATGDAAERAARHILEIGKVRS